MKKLFLIGSVLISLTACSNKQEESVPTPPSAPVPINAAPVHTDTQTIRQHFTSACVASALKGETNPSKQMVAQQRCDCIYDEGVKGYGGEAQWQAILNQDVEKSKTDAKVQQVSNDAIQLCSAKHTNNQATAVASAAK